jgi:hypothetical protein
MTTELGISISRCRKKDYENVAGLMPEKGERDGHKTTTNYLWVFNVLTV